MPKDWICIENHHHEHVGNGGLGGTKDWYAGFWCPKCKRLYAETSDGRHYTYLKKDTQKYLKEFIFNI